jgi:hypothetical protein
MFRIARTASFIVLIEFALPFNFQIQASWHEIGAGLERVQVTNTATIAVTFEQFRIQ